MNKQEKRFPEPFKFCEYIVEDFIKGADYKFVNMHGFHKTLPKLIKAIKENFKDINYLTYDIEYHGWQGEPAKNMHKIEDALVKRLLEIYIICQMALGEDIYEKHEQTTNDEESNEDNEKVSYEQREIKKNSE